MVQIELDSRVIYLCLISSMPLRSCHACTRSMQDSTAPNGWSHVLSPAESCCRAPGPVPRDRQTLLPGIAPARTGPVPMVAQASVRNGAHRHASDMKPRLQSRHLELYFSYLFHSPGPRKHSGVQYCVESPCDGFQLSWTYGKPTSICVLRSMNQASESNVLWHSQTCNSIIRHC